MTHRERKRNNDKDTHIKKSEKKCIESHRREAKINREYERIIEKERGGQRKNHKDKNQREKKVIVMYRKS